MILISTNVLMKAVSIAKNDPLKTKVAGTGRRKLNI